MTDAFLREAIAAARLEAMAASKLQRELNKIVPVRGVRESITLPGRTLDTVYYPAVGKDAPMVFVFHGGGFVFGGCALDDNLWHAVRQTLGANVISVDYRKGEENPFPAPLYDAYDAEGMAHGFLEFAYRDELEDFCSPAIVAAAADGTLAEEAARAMGFIKQHFDDWARQ